MHLPLTSEYHKLEVWLYHQRSSCVMIWAAEKWGNGNFLMRIQTFGSSIGIFVLLAGFGHPFLPYSVTSFGCAGPNWSVLVLSKYQILVVWLNRSHPQPVPSGGFRILTSSSQAQAFGQFRNGKKLAELETIREIPNGCWNVLERPMAFCFLYVGPSLDPQFQGPTKPPDPHPLGTQECQTPVLAVRGCKSFVPIQTATGSSEDSCRYERCLYHFVLFCASRRSPVVVALQA